MSPVKVIGGFCAFFGAIIACMSIFFALAYGRGNPICIPDFFTLFTSVAAYNPFKPAFLQKFADAVQSFANAFSVSWLGNIIEHSNVWNAIVAYVGNFFNAIYNLIAGVFLFLIVPIQMIAWVAEVAFNVINLQGVSGSCYVLPDGFSSSSVSSALGIALMPPFNTPVGV